jgi:hypothetical protein
MARIISISLGPVEPVGPGVNDRFLIEVVHGGHDTILEFLFGFDADVAQHRASELGEEALDEIEPRAVRGREGELESADRLLSEPRIGLFRDVRGMIVDNHLDRGVSWIGGIEKLEEFLGGGRPSDAVRFEITEVFDARYCHCNRCRKSIGAPVLRSFLSQELHFVCSTANYSPNGGSVLAKA